MPRTWKPKIRRLKLTKSYYPVSHVTPRVIRCSIPGAYIDYETSAQTMWLDMINTRLKYRRQGRAAFLLKWFVSLAKRTKKKINIMGYSSSGERYIKPLIRKLAKINEVELCD